MIFLFGVVVVVVVVVVYWETLTRLVIRDRRVETTGLRSVPPGFSKSGKRPRPVQIGSMKAGCLHDPRTKSS